MRGVHLTHSVLQVVEGVAALLQRSFTILQQSSWAALLTHSEVEEACASSAPRLAAARASAVCTHHPVHRQNVLSKHCRLQGVPGGAGLTEGAPGVPGAVPVQGTLATRSQYPAALKLVPWGQV